MSRIICTLILFAFICSEHVALGSDSIKKRPPKIGLTLCGGGAKGFAEIGVLKVLEEIDFPIDYISGNSIGSIVGAFYALGYSADTMETIVRSQNWEELMVDKVDRLNQPVLQRSVDSRYSLSVPFSKEGVAIPTGVFEGQNIMRLFSDLSIGYHGNIDFEQLPIPFRCVATDVVYGDEVVLKTGSLVDAIRASMAVPGAFTPVDWGDYLLLDGMMTNNFPVDICKDMGAEYIIGIDIQGEFAQKKDIKSLGDIMGNMTSWMAQDKYIENVQLSDFYIRPNIDNYSGADFDNASLDSLIRIGEEAARKVLPKLIQVRDSLGLQPKLRKNKSIPKLSDQYYISSVSLAGSIRTKKNEIFRRLGINAGSSATLEEIHRGVDRIYGTKYYKYVKYSLLKDNEGGYNLVIGLSEKKTDRLNLGIHYDAVNDASLLLNTTFTGKTTWGSKLAIDLRLSKNPALAIEYTMDRGRKPALGIKTSISDYEMFYYENGNQIGDLDLTFYNFDIDVHSNINDNAMIGARSGIKYFNIKNMTNFPLLEEPSDKFYLSYSAFLNFDNQDNSSFPTKGGRIKTEYNLLTKNGNPTSKSNRLNTFSFNAQWAVSIGSRFTWIPSTYNRVQWSEGLEPYFVSVIGGDLWADYLDVQLPFIGLHSKELFFQNGTVLRSDFRVRLFDKQYITLKANYGFFSNEDVAELFDPSYSSENYLNILGGGLTYSYDSPIGPIELTLSGSNFRDKANTIINIGYWF